MTEIKFGHVCQNPPGVWQRKILNDHLRHQVNSRQVFRDGELIGTLLGLDPTDRRPNRPTRYLFVDLEGRPKYEYTELYLARSDLEKTR